ncbi:MAG: nucleotide exchange factor GrpE [Actinobacteria bacterium]|nr:nucleotide exchange factor GrpE [Actinomycetota bacterium]
MSDSEAMATESPAAATSEDTPVAGLAVLAGEVRALRSEFERFYPLATQALARNEAHRTLAERLDSAERRLEGRAVQPIALALAQLLRDVRRFDRQDPDRALEHLAHVEDELAAILTRHGLREFGEAGDVFDQQAHRPLRGHVGDDGQGVVSEVHARGLAFGDDIVVKADVAVLPPDQRQEVG